MGNGSIGSTPIRSLHDPLTAFQVDREIKEIKNILLQLPIIMGIGAPEGVVAARVGTLYLRLDGGASTTLYVKESGDATLTGWVGK